MSSIEVAISYFVNKKFGIISTIAPNLSKLEAYKDSHFSKQASEIEELKETLRKMPANELLALYKKSLAKDAEQARLYAIQEESNRFYNLDSANADFSHWSKASHWSVDEAIALSFGKEPSLVTWKEIEKLKDKTAFAKAFAKRRDLAVRAKFSDEIIPLAFIHWAKKLDIELHVDLVSKVEKMSEITTNWHKKYLELKTEYDALVAKSINLQKPESIRKSNNVLQAFTAIAIDAYGYDPKSEKSTAPQDVANALDKLGAVGNAKTIRSWLKEGAELLPPNPHKI